MRQVRIRGRELVTRRAPYPLNEFPEHVIQSIAKRIVHLLAVGHTDMTGSQFEQFFSDSIDGEFFASPLGIADVAWRQTCWSVKTVKSNRPHTTQSVRLISGRNSPTYSADINDPHADIQITGCSVIDIYNARVALAREQYEEARMLVLIRNVLTREFTIFERQLNTYPVNDFVWRRNRNRNLEAYAGDRHAFTWQPHGSQFTILEPVPASATRFRINTHPVTLEVDQVLEMTGFRPDWVEIL